MKIDTFPGFQTFDLRIQAVTPVEWVLEHGTGCI